MDWNPPARYWCVSTVDDCLFRVSEATFAEIHRAWYTRDVARIEFADLYGGTVHLRVDAIQSAWVESEELLRRAAEHRAWRDAIWNEHAGDNDAEPWQ